MFPTLRQCFTVAVEIYNCVKQSRNVQVFKGRHFGKERIEVDIINHIAYQTLDPLSIKVQMHEMATLTVVIQKQGRHPRLSGIINIILYYTITRAG